MPPLMFSIEETEAVVLALALLERTGDEDLKHAAKRAAGKIAGSVPAPLRRVIGRNALHAWGDIAPSPTGITPGLVRRAIHDEQKIKIAYRDELGRTTERTIRPLALIYYSATMVIVAWCELRLALRNFRADRVDSSALADGFFRGEGDRLRKQWMAGWTSSDGGASN